jgi:hypothetical protein
VIFGEHTIGAYGDLIVQGGAGDGSGGYLMTITLKDAGVEEWLSRADVERLRDLCEEALA